jgi:hypothetical protein
MFKNLSFWDYKDHFSFYEQMKYIFISIVIFMVFQKGFENISISFLFAIFVSYWITYYSLEKSYNTKQQDVSILTRKLHLIKEPKLNIIYNDLEAINLYSSLIEYKEHNNLEFIKSMKHYNNFLEIKTYIKENVSHTGNYIDLAETEAKKSLNCLASITLSLPNSYFISSKYKNKTISNKLEDGVKELAKIIDNNLYEIYLILDKKWENEEINYNSKPVFYSPVENNMIHTPEYSKNYSLY